MGADEITFLDITASSDQRLASCSMWSSARPKISRHRLRWAVAYAIVRRRPGDLLMAGADKVSINTAAVRNPGFVAEVSAAYGAQAIVYRHRCQARSAPPRHRRWEVFTHGGRTPEGLDVLEWAARLQTSLVRGGIAFSRAWIATAPKTVTASS